MRIIIQSFDITEMAQGRLSGLSAELLTELVSLSRDERHAFTEHEQQQQQQQKSISPPFFFANQKAFFDILIGEKPVCACISLFISW